MEIFYNLLLLGATFCGLICGWVMGRKSVVPTKLKANDLIEKFPLKATKRGTGKAHLIEPQIPAKEQEKKEKEVEDNILKRISSIIKR